MKKKERKWVLIGVFVIILLSFGLYSMPSLYMGGSGLDVKSISKDCVVSTQADLNAMNFIINTVLSGRNNKVVGYATKEEFDAETGIPVQYPIELSSEAVNEYAYYMIYNDQEPVYKYNIYKPLGPLPPWYITRSAIGTKGHFDKVDATFDVKLKMKVHGQEATGYLSTTPTRAQQEYSTNLKLSDGTIVGHARWVGTSPTGQGLPEASGFAPIYSASWNQWETRHISNWDSYHDVRERADIQIRIFESAVAPNPGAVQTAIDDANRYADWIMGLEDVPIIGSNPQANADYQNRKAIRVNLRENDLVWGYPNVVWYVRAYWMGAYIPVGNCRIINVEKLNIKTGEPGSKLRVKITNTGSVDDSFDFYIRQPCDVVQDGSVRATIRKGETKTVSIPVTMGSSGVASQGGCFVQACSANWPDNCCLSPFIYKAEASDMPTNGNDIPPGTEETCYTACIRDSSCGLGITASGYMCRKWCEIKCKAKGYIPWVIGGVVVFVILIIILKGGKKSSPQMIALDMARRSR